MTTKWPTVPRLRLIDGVILASVALIGLKVLGILGMESELADHPGADELPAFGRIVANARTNYSVPDPVTTGSVAAKPKEEPPPAAKAPPKEVVPAPPLFPASQAEQALLARLGDRREELQQRAREMEDREKLIQDQERRLDERLERAKGEDDPKKAGAAAKPDEDGAGLKSLVTMYETMKPKEAARVFDRLPLDILLSVVSQMNSRKMAEILAAMTPEGAEKLTVAMAKRAKGPVAADRGSASAGLPAGELPAIGLVPPASRR